jgi:pantoate--beta-alanine ligase
VDALKLEGKSIGFVPTMGYLHKGHLSLIEESKKRTDVTFVSIFVNPTQFAPSEDFSSYPRDIARDSSILEASGTDYLFMPSTNDIYPENYQTYVDVTDITKIIEGEFRPTHFRGVTTIVSILFNCVKPDFAFFGQKDAQQATVIRQMVDDLKYNIEVVICPIIRETDGLAMSSRNVYLSQDEREKALIINKSLKQAEEIVSKGERNPLVIIKKINDNFIKERSISLNYIRIVNAETFKEVDKLESGKNYYCLIAAKVGATRLIDNNLIHIN